MLLLAVFVIDCIVNFGGPQVECVLQQMIAVDTFCAVSVRDADIIVALALAYHHNSGLFQSVQHCQFRV